MNILKVKFLICHKIVREKCTGLKRTRARGREFRAFIANKWNHTYKHAYMHMYIITHKLISYMRERCTRLTRTRARGRASIVSQVTVKGVTSKDNSVTSNSHGASNGLYRVDTDTREGQGVHQHHKYTRTNTHTHT
jgi:hypothetical protein